MLHLQGATQPARGDGGCVRSPRRQRLAARQLAACVDPPRGAVPEEEADESGEGQELVPAVLVLVQRRCSDPALRASGFAFRVLIRDSQKLSLL